MITLTSSAPLPTPTRTAVWARVVLAHLVPGLALTAFAAIVTPLLVLNGFPGIWAALIGALLVQVPLLIALTRRLRSMHEDPSDARPIRGPLARLVLAAVTLLAAALLPGLVAWAEPAIRQTVFGWLPSWWSMSPGDMGTYPPSMQVVTVVLWFSAVVVAGPIAEELYFRGELLRRIPLGPWSAAICGSALFAAYHLWQPSAFLTVFLSTLPVAIARRVFGAGMVTCCTVHCLVNAAMFAMLLAGALGR